MTDFLNDREAILYDKLKEPYFDEVLCRLCAHKCLIPNGKEGKCRTRINIDGVLYSKNWGYPLGTALDPIEKKPFFHFKPGSKVFSFGTAGCNFICQNCQNWQMSQYYISTKDSLRYNNIITPEELLEKSVNSGADGIAYTYSEPTVFFEYVLDIINQARSNSETREYYHVLVSNGFFSNELIDLIIALEIDAVNIDLKFSSNSMYREVCGGRPAPVINSIKRLYNAGVHLEITNLLIPQYNNDYRSIENLCKIVAEISNDIPIHFNRFIPKYNMYRNVPTPNTDLLMAKEIAVKLGIQFVYLGNTNITGALDTHCPYCGKILIKRGQYIINKYYGLIVDKSNCAICRDCKKKLNIIL